MGRKVCGLPAAALGLLFAAAPALAHHSFVAEYDRNQPIKFTGAVTKVEWMNPHIYYYVDVKDQAGKVTSWGCELGSPNLLLRNGWRKETLKAGDIIIVTGARAKDGSNIANAKTVRLEDGKRVFNAGSSGDQTQ